MSMTTTGTSTEKGDTLWYFKGNRCVASALVERSALADDSNGEELQVHLLCASRLQGYGTILLAAIGAHYNIPMTLNALPKSLSFYRKLGFTLQDPDNPDVLYFNLKHPWSLMARVKRIPPQPRKRG